VSAYAHDDDLTIWHGSAERILATLDEHSIDAIVTSPPYLDQRPEVDALKAHEFLHIFTALMRVLKPTGTFALNLGRVFRDSEELRWWEEVLELAETAGFVQRDHGIWIKPNANPIHGPILANSHEFYWLLSPPHPAPFERWNTEAVRTAYAQGSEARLRRNWVRSRAVKDDEGTEPVRREPNDGGARARSFVAIDVGREKGIRHPSPMALDFASYLVQLCSWEGMTVLDPFGGAGTTGVACRRLGRKCVLIEREMSYCAEAARRCSQLSLMI